MLVGDPTLGKHGLRDLPSKSLNSPDMFDSATDDMNNPSMFVIFSDTQAYPEFLIEIK